MLPAVQSTAYPYEDGQEGDKTSSGSGDVSTMSGAAPGAARGGITQRNPATQARAKGWGDVEPRVPWLAPHVSQRVCVRFACRQSLPSAASLVPPAAGWRPAHLGRAPPHGRRFAHPGTRLPGLYGMGEERKSSSRQPRLPGMPALRLAGGLYVPPRLSVTRHLLIVCTSDSGPAPWERRAPPHPRARGAAQHARGGRWVSG